MQSLASGSRCEVLSDLLCKSDSVSRLRAHPAPCNGRVKEPLSPAGVHYVFDTTAAADFSILESQKEFVRRYRQHTEEKPALPMLTSACPGRPPAAVAVPHWSARGGVSPRHSGRRCSGLVHTYMSTRISVNSAGAVGRPDS